MADKRSMLQRLTPWSPRGATLLAVYAAGLLTVSYFVPWWRMECMAPQYGMRVLVVEVSPTGATGDIDEMDRLGHFVGIRPIETYAPIERALAPYAVGLIVLLVLGLPFVRHRWYRWAVAAAVLAVPIGFSLDMWLWQHIAVTDIDYTAPMSNIQDRFEARLVGHYRIAQFKVDAFFHTGFWLVSIATLNVLGFLFATFGRRGKTAPGDAEAGLDEAADSKGSRSIATVLLVTGLGLGAPGAIEASASGEEVVTLGAGPVITVGPGASLAEAIAAAVPGTTLRLSPDVYEERVIVDRPLAIEGVAGTILDGGGTGTVLEVRAGPCAIRGLKVRGSGARLLSADAGIRIDGAEDCTIEDNEVVDSLFGIVVNQSERALVRRNTVIGKDLPVTGRGDGIRLFYAPGAIVEDNTVRRTRDLAIWHSADVAVRRNRVSEARYGLHFMYSDDNLFEENVFRDNHVGGAVMYSRRLTLRRNSFASSRGPSAHGLLLKAADDVVAEENRFVDNTRGLFIEDSPSSATGHVVFRRNVIAGNDVGVSLPRRTTRVLFAENVFASNRLQVVTRGRPEGELAVWSEDGRGNYWSDYLGYDLAGDGVGDLPHEVEHHFEHLVDRWEGAGLLRLGPAAEALEAAARAFPILEPTVIVRDAHPLVRPPHVEGHVEETSGSVLLGVAGVLMLAGAAFSMAWVRRIDRGGTA